MKRIVIANDMSLLCTFLISWICINQKYAWNVMRITLKFDHLPGKNTLFECICNRALLKIVIFIKSTAVMNMSNRFTLLGISLIGRIHRKQMTTLFFLGITNLLVSEFRYYFLTSVTAAHHHYQYSCLNSPTNFICIIFDHKISLHLSIKYIPMCWQ